MTDNDLEAGIELVDTHPNDVQYGDQVITLNVGRGLLHVVEISLQMVAAVCGSATNPVLPVGRWDHAWGDHLERCTTCVEIHPPETLR